MPQAPNNRVPLGPSGSYPGAMSGYFLNDATVQDDGAGNVLEGGPALDWYLANLDGVGTMASTTRCMAENPARFSPKSACRNVGHLAGQACHAVPDRLADLDGDEFEKRDAARLELERLDDVVLPIARWPAILEALVSEPLCSEDGRMLAWRTQPTSIVA